MSALSEKSIALVGSAGACRNYRELLGEFPELALEAVVGAGSSQGTTESARSFASIAEMLAAGCVPQLAVVCSPVRDRARDAEALLRAGVDVLVEPPLAMEPDEADRITALAERAGRIASTAAPFRSLPGLREASRLIERGRIGRLCAIECDLSQKRERPEAGIWMESGPHAIDLVEALAGPAERIRMLSHSPLAPASEDSVLVEVEHCSQLVSRISMTWLEERGAPIARCIGERGEILIGRAQTILRTEDGSETVTDGLYSEREAYREVLRDFLAACRASERPIDHGVESVAWIRAAYRSLESKCWELS